MRFGRRDYSAQVGRWTDKDPAHFETGATNLYAYVGNDPVGFVDSAGFFGVRDTWSWTYGHAWGAQNTVYGLIYALVGVAAGGGLDFTANAIEVRGHPFQRKWGGPGSAITLGNVICLADSSPKNAAERQLFEETEAHEVEHTYQSDVLGPFYLPAHGVAGLMSMVTSGKWSADGWHVNNFMEWGPMSKPPHAWPWPLP